MNENTSSRRVAMAAFVAWIAVNIILAGLLVACLLQSEPEGIVSVLLMLALVNTLAFVLRRSRGEKTPAVGRSLIQKGIGYVSFCAGAFGCKVLLDYNGGLGNALLFAAACTTLYILAEVLIGHWKASSDDGTGT